MGAVLFDVKDRVAVLTLNRPDRLNTFNIDLATELNGLLKKADKDEDVNVVVVKGNGRGFSAGIDLKELSERTPFDYYNITTLMEEMTLTIANMKKPVIASVHGFAVANGAGLAAAADLAIAADGTKFGLTAINVGISCIGPTVAVMRNLTKKRTLELLFTGKMIDAKRAEEIGLINEVVAPDKLESRTMRLASELASKSPLALQLTKQAFYKMSDLELSKALEIANYNFSMLCTLEDAKEGIDAFLKKRKPEWKMR